MKPLYKRTLVIWADYDTSLLDLDALGRDAQEGESYCSRSITMFIEHPEQDPDWDGTDFFHEEKEEADEKAAEGEEDV